MNNVPRVGVPQLTPVPQDQQCVVVSREPVGVPHAEDFRIESTSIPAVLDGELLVRTIDLSLDPYLRSVMAGRHMGHAAPAIGHIMPGRATAQVVVSSDPAFDVGAYVLAETGWREYASVAASSVRRLDHADVPLSAALGILGMPGLTAWAGVTQLMSLQPGETFAVSAPLGPVGSTAGQLARQRGCRVVGIAGSDEKCAAAVGHFGFDACVNYREASWEEALRTAAPDGVHAYFDNAGGAVLEGVLRALNLRGTIVLCGLIGQYNTGVPYALPLGPVIGKRAHLHGLVVYDFEHRQAEYLAEATPLLRDGMLRLLEDRSEGLASAPTAFSRLMRGENVGKALVAVSPA